MSIGAAVLVLSPSTTARPPAHPTARIAAYETHASTAGHRGSGARSLVAPGLRSGTLAVGAAGQLHTYDYTNNRDGVDTADAAFGKLQRAWSDSGTVISGGIFGQPLVDGNLVIVATERDFVYALNATTGKVAWRVSIGNPAFRSVFDSAPTLSSGCGDINPLGITSTPVIDPALSEVFVAGEVQSKGTSGWQGIKHILVGVKFGALTAKIVFNHQIDPPGASHTYYVPAEQQRASLTLSAGRVYVEFGGLSGDCGLYQGWVVSEPENGTAALQSFKVPTAREGAIWSTGGAATSRSGELFVATGNAANQPGQPFDYGDSVIGLSPALKIDSYFAPKDWAQRSARDLDLGSAGPILIDNNSLVFEIGKAGPDGVSSGFLLNPAKLGGIGGELYNRPVCPNGGFVFGADASSLVRVGTSERTYVFVPCPTGTVALWVHGGSKPNFSVVWHASSGDPNGPPIVAGGLVWALATDGDGGGGPFRLSGMNPVTGTVEVTESVPTVEHFATAGAGDGMIFVSGASGVTAFK